MPFALDIDGIVERLEASCMPRLADFPRLLALSNPHIVAETFSHRHAEVTHNLGLSCHPVGTDSLDPRTVALIVTVIAIKEPSMKGYVAWQSPSFHHEGETAIYNAFGETEFARFAAELDGLLSVLAAAAQRGVPPETGHNPPM
jgi:hypothetical protein